MPKGKGAAGAFAADEESVRESGARQQLESEGEPIRLSISLPKAVIFAADRRVLERKQKGESLNRSAYIAELIRRDLED